jgi:hypothetical protein
MNRSKSPALLLSLLRGEQQLQQTAVVYTICGASLLTGAQWRTQKFLLAGANSYGKKMTHICNSTKEITG